MSTLSPEDRKSLADTVLRFRERFDSLALDKQLVPEETWKCMAPTYLGGGLKQLRKVAQMYEDAVRSGRNPAEIPFEDGKLRNCQRGGETAQLATLELALIRAADQRILSPYSWFTEECAIEKGKWTEEQRLKIEEWRNLCAEVDAGVLSVFPKAPPKKAPPKKASDASAKKTAKQAPKQTVKK
mmetsp:Transcript_47743/g.97596  ORF Transcript_47743/g.97596 Transcript_47743/m.97596 type:complete len:184 (+) Transcript_47743:115-666(+)|eukprot:CAMPEP_0181315850 /NCGR_PEP_ID=MMETSP1101-20121128/15589_1 /TAXON_ID=46948 /ORGANISM="Rhodomonas abbreviata, Strain Caron Lab Isolate" /LENGTH=183 /DNA_ID=CAMNT_0023423073 /DNA_START=110 /DNA_END=661 /DNA_ORIENTATION=-